MLVKFKKIGVAKCSNCKMSQNLKPELMIENCICRFIESKYLQAELGSTAVQ